MTNWPVFLAGCAAVFGALYVLHPMLTPFVAGLVIAYLLIPVVNRLAATGLGRNGASLIVVFSFIGMLVGVLAVAIPALSRGAARFASNVPQYVTWLRETLQAHPRFDELMALYGDHLQRDAVVNQLSEYSDQLARMALNTLQGAALSAFHVVDLVMLLVITPLTVYYVMRDWPAFLDKAKNLIPAHKKAATLKTFKRMDTALSGFLHGQFLVMVVLSVYYAAALALVGLDMGLVLGVIIGMTSFIPFVGVALGVVLSFTFALIQFQLADMTPYMLLAGIMAVGYVLENFILVPKLVGDKVGLHPMWVIFAVMAGGELAGFLGVLIALPVATVLTVLIPLTLDVWHANVSPKKKRS